MRHSIPRNTCFFIFIIVYCVHSLESPNGGDSNECTQHTIINISLIEAILMSAHNIYEISRKVVKL